MPNSIPDTLSISQSAGDIVPIVPKILLLNLFGTNDSFETRDSKKARTHTMAALQMAVRGDAQASGKSRIDPNIITCTFDGPVLTAKNIYEIIAKATLECLTHIGQGVETIHINSHSRGACAAIFLSNVLEQISKNLKDYYASSEPRVELSIEILLKDCHKDIQLAAKSLPSSADSLNACEAKKISDAFQSKKVGLNIFAIDPVPGNHVNSGRFGTGFWLDTELRTLPPIVKKYTQIEMRDEKSWYFNSLVPKAVCKSSTVREIIRLPGNHCNPCGQLDVQQAPDVNPMPPPAIINSQFKQAESQIKRAQLQLIKAEESMKPKRIIAAKKNLKSAEEKYLKIISQKKALVAVQDLVIYKMLDSMMQSGITQYDSSSIIERTIHPAWGDTIKPLRKVINKYQKSSFAQRQKIKLSAYNDLSADKEIFTNYIATNYYPFVRSNGFFNKTRESHSLRGKGEARKFSPYQTSKVFKIGSFVNLEHLVLYTKDLCFQDERLLPLISSIDHLFAKSQKNHHQSVVINSRITETCESVQTIIETLVTTYDDTQRAHQSSLNSIILNIIPAFVDSLVLNLLNTELSIHEYEIVMTTLSRISESTQAKIHSQDFDVYNYIFSIIKDKITSEEFDIETCLNTLPGRLAQTDSDQEFILKQVQFLNELRAKHLALIHLQTVCSKLDSTDCYANILEILKQKTNSFSSTLIAEYSKCKNLLERVPYQHLFIKSECTNDSFTTVPNASSLESPTTLANQQDMDQQVLANIAVIQDYIISISPKVYLDLQQKVLGKDKASTAESPPPYDEQIRRASQQSLAIKTAKALASIKFEEQIIQGCLDVESKARLDRESLLAQNKLREAHRHQIRLIKIKAIKIGFTVGAIVILGVGSTLAVYFLAPAVMPVLLAHIIFNATGFTLLTPAVALKSAILCTFAGLVGGFGTEAAVKHVLKKQLPQSTAHQSTKAPEVSKAPKVYATPASPCAA